MNVRKTGKNVAVLRKNQGLTQERLAKRARVHRNTIIELENGRLKGVRYQTLERVAKVLGLSVAELTDSEVRSSAA